MKRPFNLFDGLFLLALYFKLTNTGPHLSWFTVFLPYVVECGVVLVLLWTSTAKWSQRVRFWFWKWQLKQNTKRAANFAAASMGQAYQEGLRVASKEKTKS